MTNPTNWPNPERPGVPMFHERDGWHLLQFLGLTEACRWRPLERPKEWITTVGMGFTRAELAREGVVYIGPVLTPTQIAELLAGEQERCAKECERLKPSMDEIIGNSFFGVRGVALVDAAAAIRNLGAAP